MSTNALAFAFARQAMADFRTYQFLERTAIAQVEVIPVCHRLLFLQMACEKLSRARLYRQASDLGPQRRGVHDRTTASTRGRRRMDRWSALSITRSSVPGCCEPRAAPLFSRCSRRVSSSRSRSIRASLTTVRLLPMFSSRSASGWWRCSFTGARLPLCLWAKYRRHNRLLARSECHASTGATARRSAIRLAGNFMLFPLPHDF
jgi:hypothetical protein